MAQRQRADEAERTLAVDAAAAARDARGLLSEPTTDDGAAAIAHRVLAMEALRRDDMPTAAHHFDESIAAAERSDDDDVLVRALLAGVAVAASRGDAHGALLLADRAETHASDALAVAVAIQRGGVLVAGFSRTDEAIELFDRVLAEHPSVAGRELAMLRLNRGTELLRIGDLGAAVDDLVVAAEEFRLIGDHYHRTAAELHRAVAAARMGDLPTVFEIYQRLDDEGLLSASDPADQTDLARCLIVAGLLTEADAVMDGVIEAMSEGPPTPVTVQVEVLGAQVKRLLGEPGARDLAVAALASAERLGSEALAAIALVESVATRDAGSSVTDARLRRAVAVLEREGHRREAIDARIELAQRAVEHGDTTSVGSPMPIKPGMTPLERAQIRHLRALQLCAVGDAAGARRQLVAGIRDIERARASIAAADVRAAASDRAPQMAALGLDLAIRAGRPRPVLEWAERVRATGLRLSDAHRLPPSLVRDELDELREAERVDRVQAAHVERRIVKRDRARRGAGEHVRSLSAGDICDALGPDRMLLEFVEVDGRLWRCTVEGKRASLCDLGISTADLDADIGKLLFGLRRMSSRTGPSADAAAAMVEGLTDRMADALLPSRLLGQREFVVVPTGSLHRMPWASLRPLRTLPFVVAPSAHMWSVAGARRDGGEGTVVATGPGLRAAEAEAHEVAACWGSNEPPLLETSSNELSRRLDGCSIAHLCCHGRFRSDSPQFSALELSDGPFTVFDFDAIVALPPLVVLSACSLGSVDVRLGDDLLGFPAAMFSRGVATLVAALMPVEDEATRPLMVDLHTHLTEGCSPAEALGRARAAAHERGPAHVAAAAAFTCFGRG